MPVLLTYGDSNTHGTPPVATRGLYARHPPADRWPRVCAAALGPAWELVEEGLPGRTAGYPDPVMGAHMNGAEGLKIALQSHGPIDVLTIMLGTNDIKTRYGARPEMVAGQIAALLDIALHPEMQTRHGGFRILVIAPPPVAEAGVLAMDFWGAAEKSRALAPLLRALAASRGAGFLDAGDTVEVSPVDGVHWDAAAHRHFGAVVADAVRALEIEAGQHRNMV